jgi:hypothetical protein
VTIGLVVALAGRAGDGEQGTADIDATDSTATGADGSTPQTLPARDQSTTTSTTSTTVEPATDTPAVTTAPPTDPTTTTDRPTTTNDPPAPPTIGGFRASLQRGACEQALPGTAIVWQTSGGTTHSVGAPDGSVAPVGSEGSQVFCPHQPGTWTLTVMGSGGTATATASL